MKYKNVPSELKQLERWVCWKADKSPVNPRTGGGAMSNNPATWGSYEDAVGSVDRYGCAGVGFMLGDGILGIDLDHCYNPETGELTEAAADIVATVRSYTEFSPSGTGLHILCAGRLPKGARRNNQAGIEMYEAGRYFTVTGAPWGAPLPFLDASEAVAAVHAKYMAKKEQAPPAAAPMPVPRDDSEILDAAFRSKDGRRFEDLYRGNWQSYYASQSEADLAFCNMLAFWFGAEPERMARIFRASGLYRKKWDEMHGEQTYGAMTLGKAASECRETYTPAPSKLQQARRAAPGKKGTAAKSYPMDDTGNAQRFRDAMGENLRFSHTDKVWYVWDGARWRFDDTGGIKRMADEMLDQMEKDLFGMQDPDAITAYKANLRRARSNKGKEAMLKETQHLEGIPVLQDAFDKHKGLLNTPSGIVTLKDGKLQPHRKEYYLTRMAGATLDPKADCPTWLRFLEDITAKDKELMHYLQCMIGYCLSGSVREQCVFFLYGTGSNGKSTFVNTVRELLGDYAMNTQAESIMVRDRSGGARGDLARLKGARLVTVSEPEEGMVLNEGLIKDMTGGEPLTARFLYGREFEYKPEFKVLMATNHKPRIKGTDFGIWRRIKLIPFTMQLPASKQDRNLSEKLRGELPGILNWAIKGSLAWQKNARAVGSGLPACQAVDAAVEEYKGEMDRLKQFLDECIAERPNNRLQASLFYKIYYSWCHENGERFPITATKFGREMKKRYDFKEGRMVNEYLHVGLTDAGLRYMTMSGARRSEVDTIEQMTLPKQ